MDDSTYSLIVRLKLKALTSPFYWFDVLKHDTHSLDNLKVNEPIVMRKDLSKISEPIPLYERIHVAFVDSFTKHAILG
jgi:hypothetical protein